ncbi:rho guanine nucleotide exchange factor 17-like isoform X1 [Melanerpes formicivorus]|uniref:rho guanine nucleotide exchange factor 17-like isoform X1 n=2 Tax=Melanerpes formicivorus TaxID=211600 RepID=UPI00358F8810
MGGRLLLGPPKLQMPVPGLPRDPHHRDGGSGREAVVRLPQPSHRPQHTTLAQEHTLQVGQDSGRGVTCMVSAGSGVWVALQSSAQVRLYHATSYEQLAEADITPPVHKMLAGATRGWHGTGSGVWRRTLLSQPAWGLLGSEGKFLGASSSVIPQSSATRDNTTRCAWASAWTSPALSPLGTDVYFLFVGTDVILI